MLGDPTEACLLVSAQKAGLDLSEVERHIPRVRELPFESRRKRMSTIHQLERPLDGATRVAFVKGAPNELVRLSTKVRVNGGVMEMTDSLREKIMHANDGYAEDGLRVLAVAYRPIHRDEKGVPTSVSEYTPDVIEHDLTFVGLEVMQDPPRPEVAAAVAECRRAGIRVIMITGDYGLTAVSIARKIGIVKSAHPKVFSGPELEKTSDEELRKALEGEVVFSRMAPEQKLRVVENLQAMGEVVAVTGDGVNDSPALKKADIGVAMGVTGTDVAKEAADMILTDDNFASIVSAVEEGRAVYANIRKFMLYILNSNVPEAVPSAVYLFSGGAVPLPLTTMQILTIDLGTDMFPALGLGSEPPEKDVMNRPPRDPSEPLLTGKVMRKAFLWYGILGALSSLGAFFFAQWVFPLQMHFANPVKTTMKNAVLLGLGRFPRTLGMAAIWAVPVLLLLFTTALVPLVLMFGLSFPGLVMAYLYSPVFKKFEPEVEEVSDENFDEDSAEKDDAYRSLAQMQEENRRIEQELEKKDQEKAEKV